MVYGCGISLGVDTWHLNGSAISPHTEKLGMAEGSETGSGIMDSFKCVFACTEPRAHRAASDELADLLLCREVPYPSS